MNGSPKVSLPTLMTLPIMIAYQQRSPWYDNGLPSNQATNQKWIPKVQAEANGRLLSAVWGQMPPFLGKLVLIYIL